MPSPSHTLTTKTDKAKYYAVSIGRVPGIYDNWTAASRQTDQYSCATVQHFKTLQAAKGAMIKAGIKIPKYSVLQIASSPKNTLC